MNQATMGLSKVIELKDKECTGKTRIRSAFISMLSL